MNRRLFTDKENQDSLKKNAPVYTFAEFIHLHLFFRFYPRNLFISL